MINPKYFIDAEFVEDGSTIELISIGIVCEDGRQYYALNYDGDFSKADDWVKANVLSQIPKQPIRRLFSSEAEWKASAAYLAGWRTRGGMAAEIKEFMNPNIYGKPKTWGYYSAYDHVAFCQIFGKMIDLPEDFPMYMRDLKQWCDALGNPQLPAQGKGLHDALADALWNKQVYEFLEQYQRSHSFL
jgi:3' exoribonuclease, RNase T-like